MMRIIALATALICTTVIAEARWRNHNPPTAANITVNTPINTAISINLAQGSTGAPTSATVIGAVTGGTETKTGALTVKYTPGIGFCGCGGFDFTLFNAYGTSNQAHVTINVP